MDIEGGLAVAGAAASLSMADVDMNKTGKQDAGEQKITLIGSITYIAVLASMVTAVLAMAIYGSSIVYAFGCISLAVAPVVGIQRFLLGRMETFRGVHNALRQEVNRLQVENNDLEAQIDSLQKQSARVKQIEGGLRTIVESQGQSTDTFVAAVKENGLIITEIEGLLLNEVVQNIISTVLRADMDQDFTIDPEEVNALILRIKSLPGVEQVDEAQIRAMLTNGSGIEAVVSMVKNISAQSPEKRLVQVSSRGLLM